MQANSSSAFFLSATLHGVVVAMILLMTYVWLTTRGRDVKGS